MLVLKLHWPQGREESSNFIKLVMRFNEQFGYEVNYKATDSIDPIHMEMIFRSEVELAYFMMIAGNKINVLS